MRSMISIVVESIQPQLELLGICGVLPTRGHQCFARDYSDQYYQRLWTELY